MDDDKLQQTQVGATSNLDTSDTASDKTAIISQGQKKGIDDTDKISSVK